MIEYIHELINGKKVLILGFGREGKSTLPFLIKASGAGLIAIADARPINAELPDGVITITGEDYLNCLNDFDVVFKSPGIVLDREIDEYTCNIVSQMEVFFGCYRDRIIGITGTKGKSTTTTLLYHVLKSAGADVMLAGNIGIPVFEIADMMKDTTTAVLELSCHQLEYMDVSAHHAVYLNLHEEHLDHYGTMAKYTAAKENIYKNQLPGDELYCLDTLAPSAGKCSAHINTFGRKNVSDRDTVDFYLDGTEICYKKKDGTSATYKIPADEIKLIGEHNYFDIAFVYAVSKNFGVTDEVFSQALKTYEPLPHRLQFIGVQDKIKWYDDSISTIDETTIQALNTLSDADTVIIGGMDRGISYRELEEYLAVSPVKNIILMEASGKRIFEEIKSMGDAFERTDRLYLAEHLEDAVEMARKLTGEGRSCVMSPAAASYGIFKNFEDRGEAFCRLVYGTAVNENSGAEE